MSFVLVRTPRSIAVERVAEVIDAYNFGGSSLLFTSVDSFGFPLSVVEVAEGFSAQNQADRFSSGLFGAAVADDVDELRVKLSEWQEPLSY